MQEPDLQATVKAYLEAFEARDLPRCLGFYDEEATIFFHTGTYRGKREIEAWHRDRFDADMRMTRIDSISVQGDMVMVEGTAASNRLRAWKIKSINGIMTLLFQKGKIKEAKFSARMGPLQML